MGQIGLLCRAAVRSTFLDKYKHPTEIVPNIRLNPCQTSEYRDSKKREADAVIQFSDGSWALIEVKLGGEDDIIQAGKNLIGIANDIDWEKTGKPAFLMVVTKNKVAYQMDNGVYVVPLCCLKN